MKAGDLVRHRPHPYRRESIKFLGVLIEPKRRYERGSGPLRTKIEHKGKLIDFTMPTGGDSNTRPVWAVLSNGSIECWDERDIILEQSTTPLG
jgi:hypothetical protein